MRRLLLILTILLTIPAVCARGQHLVRMGWGDSLFESLAFHPANGTSAYTYTGHIFADYHYSITPFFSVGGQLDFQSICWTTAQNLRSRNYDLSILPTVRFTWLRRKWIRLYSGLGAGLLFAFDNAGGRDFLPVFNLNSIGIQFGDGPWCGSVDLGFMVALRGTGKVYMLGSRLLSVGVNYRW